MGFNRAIAKTTLIAITAVAIIAFAMGFITRPPSQILTTTTAREFITVTSPQIVTETLVKTVSITTGALVTNVSTIYKTVTSTETIRHVETTTIASTIVSTTTQVQGLPQGATPLPSVGKTVFALISTGFNFNGSSGGALTIYIPAGWGVEITFTNSHTVRHSIAIVRNNTASPQSSDIGSEGTIIASQPPQYSSGISPGSTAQLVASSLPEGVYWVACGVPGHARAGMWIVLVSSPSVSIPYAIASQPSGGGYSYGYGGYIAVVVPVVLLPVIYVAIMTIMKRGSL